MHIDSIWLPKNHVRLTEYDFLITKYEKKILKKLKKVIINGDRLCLVISVKNKVENIEDISFLSGLISLKLLWLQKRKIKDVSAIGEQYRLTDEALIFKMVNKWSH